MAFIHPALEILEHTGDLAIVHVATQDAIAFHHLAPLGLCGLLLAHAAIGFVERLR